MIKFQHSYLIALENDSILFFSQWFRKEYKLTTSSNLKLYEILSTLQSGFFSEKKFLKIMLSEGYSSDFGYKLLRILLDKKILIYTHEKDKEYRGRYGRQELFLDNFERDYQNGEYLNNELQNKRVVIVGVGGYGTWTAMLFARMGVKHIAIVDSDIVEESDLNRQVLYDFADIGKRKVDVCKEKIVAIDSEIKVEVFDEHISSVEELFSIVVDADLVMNSFGYFPLDMEYGKSSFYVNEACMIKKIPCLNYNGSWVGPIFEGENSPCYFCMMQDKEIIKGVKYSLPVKKDKFLAAFAPRMSYSSSIAVWEAVRFLLNLSAINYLKDNIIVIDTLYYDKNKMIKIKAVDGCKYCKKIQ